MDQESRFWKKVIIPDDPKLCWLWTGYRHPHGYGQFKFNGKLETAHRVSYALKVGAIPLGMSVLHHCDNPPCVNPDHLFTGSQADNIRDGISKGRYPQNTGYRALRETCSKGHELTEANIYIHVRKSGRKTRCCRLCKNETNREYRERKG